MTSVSDQAAVAFLSEESLKYPGLADHYSQCSTLYTKKLWHQLTRYLLKNVLKNSTFSPESLLDLYNNFISKFSKHLNKIALARILVRISKQYKDLTVAIDFLQSLIISQFNGSPVVLEEDEPDVEMANNKPVKEKETDTKKSKPVEPIQEKPDTEETKKQTQMEKISILLLQCEIAHIHLIANSIKKCKLLLEQITNEITIKKSIVSCPQELYVQYYRVSLQFYKTIGKAEKFLYYSLLFLQYTTANDLTKVEQSILASDICLAALLSEKCYTFSVLISHPLIETLYGHNQHDWLYQMINIFNLGDLKKWNSFVERFRDQLMKHPTLSKQMPFLEQKMRLMALMELVFQGDTIVDERKENENEDTVSSNSYQLKRVLKFEQICSYCDIENSECEYVLMRAFSLGIIKGIIDEIDRTVNISYIIPRHLNGSQVQQLHSKMNGWLQQIQDCGQEIQAYSKEIGLLQEQATMIKAK